MKTISRAISALWDAKVRVLPVASLLILVWATLAYAATLQEKQFESIQAESADCDTVTGGCHFLLLGGLDTNNVVTPFEISAAGMLADTELPAAAALADNAANPTAPAVGSFLMGWDSATWDRISSQSAVAGGFFTGPATGALLTASTTRFSDGAQWGNVEGFNTMADDTANTTNTMATASFLFGYESVGAVWDRLRMDTGGNLFVSLATALDGAIDSVSIEVNGTIPQLDSTDRLAVSIYGFNAAAGDTQPTVTTTQADDLAGTLDTLNVTGFNMVYDGTTFDLWRSISAGSDDLTTPTVGVAVVANFPFVRDGEDGNSDRVVGYDTDTDDLAVASEANTMGVTNFPMVYDTPSNQFDRMSKGMVTGYGVTGATPDRVTITNATTDAAVNLAVGYYQIQIVADTADTVFCLQGADGSGTASATSDMPYKDTLVYRVQVTSTSTDSFECITSANQAFFYITPITF